MFHRINVVTEKALLAVDSVVTWTRERECEEGLGDDVQDWNK